jgi:hypothetical protein
MGLILSAPNRGGGVGQAITVGSGAITDGIGRSGLLKLSPLRPVLAICIGAGLAACIPVALSAFTGSSGTPQLAAAQTAPVTKIVLSSSPPSAPGISLTDSLKAPGFA